MSLPGREGVKGTNAVEPAEDSELSNSSYSCCGESPWEEKYGDRQLSPEVMEDETTFKVAKKSFHQVSCVRTSNPISFGFGDIITNVLHVCVDPRSDG